MTVQETYEDLHKTFSERSYEKEKYKVQLRTDNMYYRVLCIRSGTYYKQFQYDIGQIQESELQSFVMNVCDIILRSMFVVSYCIKILEETPEKILYEIEIL